MPYRGLHVFDALIETRSVPLLIQSCTKEIKKLKECQVYTKAILFQMENWLCLIFFLTALSVATALCNPRLSSFLGLQKDFTTIWPSLLLERRFCQALSFLPYLHIMKIQTASLKFLCSFSVFTQLLWGPLSLEVS